MDRLDVFLANNGYTRSYASKLIVSGRVSVNGSVVTKPSFPVSSADLVDYTDFDPVRTELKSQSIPLSIVYEDDDLFVIDKPRGMVVHPSKGHEEGTLVNALLGLESESGRTLSTIGGQVRPGIVHRLDKDTSGLILVAKNDVAHAALSAQMERREITRIYLALVHGITECEGSIDARIARDKKNRLKMAVVRGKEGREAITRYRTRESYRKYSLVEAGLGTGRTHQIRVHMAFIGHPVVGDPVYGRTSDAKVFGTSQILHSCRLSFLHPRTRERVDLSCKMPEYFEEAVEKARRI